MSKANIAILFILILIATTPIFHIEAQPSLDVWTDKATYKIGEWVEICFFTDSSVPVEVTLVVSYDMQPVSTYGPYPPTVPGQQCVDFAKTNQAGTYFVEVTIKDPNNPTNEIKASTTFNVEPDGVGQQTWPPNIGVQFEKLDPAPGERIDIIIQNNDPVLWDATVYVEYQGQRVNDYGQVTLPENQPTTLEFHAYDPGEYMVYVMVPDPQDPFDPSKMAEYKAWTRVTDAAPSTALLELLTAPEYHVGDTVIVEARLTGTPDPITINLEHQGPGLLQPLGSVELFPGAWTQVKTFTVTEVGSYTVSAFEVMTSQPSASTQFQVTQNGGQQPSGLFDFTLGLTPTSITVKVGDTANYMILITYSDPSHAGTMINIQVTGLGPGMNSQLAQTGSLTITTSPTTPPGTYTFTVIGSAQGKTHQTKGTLIVSTEAPTTTQTPTVTTPIQTMALAGDFTILPSPIDMSIFPGETASFTLTVDKIGEFSDSVAFTTVSGQPVESTMDLRPEEGIPRYTADLRIETPEYTQPGTYKVTVEASGGGKTHTVTLTLTIKGNPQETPTTTEAETTETTAAGSSITALLSNPIYLMVTVIAVLAAALGATALRRGRAPTPAPARPEPSAGYCLNCGARLRPRATFCRSCGQKIE